MRQSRPKGAARRDSEAEALAECLRRPRYEVLLRVDVVRFASTPRCSRALVSRGKWSSN
jgi:hypothetical protein